MQQKKTLVLGASDNPMRYSYLAINSLVRRGHPVVAIGLKETEVAGVKVLTTPAPFADVDTITLYLNPMRQEQYYDYILSLKPDRVIFNPGTENPELYKLLKQNNIEIEIACTLVMLSTSQF
ncbi:CoA-binding protein [Flavobacterium sp.]|uniref:CoA-binding protein n=1 Tax=Flavobacterium sp. TaxID=239 RepID=UPI001201296A|nr:CoA-binding protein [Flavobacterium sp.]RZJ70954.1 MAG: CoA-binding protein [Flavobacterium sp.]